MHSIHAAAALALLFIALCPAVSPAQSTDAGVRQMLQNRLASSSVADAVKIDDENLLSPDSVRSFYDERHGAPVWNTGNRFGSLSQDLLAVLRSADEHGLEPRNYHEGLVERMAALPYEQLEAARRVDIELLFTDALLAFSNDLLRGRARSVELKGSMIDASEDVHVNDAAYAAIAAGRLQRLAEILAPEAAEYQRIREALSAMRAAEAADEPFDLPERTLHPGDTGGEVAALRRRLAMLGDLPGSEDGDHDVFDPALTEAVKRFQSRHGLDTDGVVGQQTRAALETPLSRRIEQLKLSLERWRWLPRDPGDRYLIVNIGGQELEAVENGRRTLHMRVVVGKPYQRTPSFASNIEALVLNPYWNVPYSIAVKEILPKLRSDPAYLAQENMQVLRRVAGEGTLVDPSSVDWSQVPAKDFPYRFRQKPGPGNALGAVKFLLPNVYSVYLHDTPAKSLFAQSRRSFSHGCVRLEHPFELADLLLRDEPGWSLERVKSVLDKEQNYHIRLTRRMPVYLVYLTAWVDNEGILHFRDDLYGRDKSLEAAFENLNT